MVGRTAKRVSHHIMPMRIFTDVSNISSLVVCAFDALVFNSIAYLLPLYLQNVLDKSPTVAGIYMLAIALPLAIVSLLSGWVIEMTGRFLETLQVGLLIMTIGVDLLITFDTSCNAGKIIGSVVIIGVGFGPTFGAPLIALRNRVQESDIATGTAAFNFVRMVFGAIGLVSGQVMFQLSMRSHQQAFIDIGIDSKFAQVLANGEAISQASDITLLERDRNWP